jgi:large subunit ribosomal protein L15
MASSLNDIQVVKGSKFEHYRRGQGLANGGRSAGKGTKGQGQHAHTKKHGFEGGQMPLARRLPKYGFNSISRIELAIVNLDGLNTFKDGDVVDETVLNAKGLVKNNANGIKILGKGVLDKKLTVKAHAFSAGAKKAIEAKGGTVEAIK